MLSLGGASRGAGAGAERGLVRGPGAHTEGQGEMEADVGAKMAQQCAGEDNRGPRQGC